MDGRLTWTDCDEAGDYFVPNVLSPRDLVFRPDNTDETVPHTSDQVTMNMMILTQYSFVCYAPMHSLADLSYIKLDSLYTFMLKYLLTYSLTYLQEIDVRLSNKPIRSSSSTHR